MAKQTFTTGQVLTAAQMTSLQQTAMLGGDASAKTSSYTLVAADAGTAISMSNASATTITVNTGLFAAGDIVTIVNLGAGVCTITAGTATVATSGSLALAQNQGGVLRFTSASAAIFFQFATPASGDIEGVTAGTGISGGGTSGTVTITNSMATAIDAKGDLIAGTGADTFSRLAVGANGTVLTVDSAEATGMKWAAAGGSLTMSEIATGTLSGTQLQIASLTSYDDIWFFVNGVNPSSTCSLNFTINNLVGANLYRTRRIYEIQSNLYPTPYNFNSTSLRVNDSLQGSNTDNIFWVHFSNCKAAGLTTFEFGFAYYKSSPNYYVAEWGGGYYNSAATVSTIEMNFGSSVSGGTYYVIAG